MDTEVKKRSVTANDQGNKYSSVIRWVLNYAPRQQTGLPTYWSPMRDYHLRQTLYTEFHDFWAGAVGIAATKMSSLAWDLESSQPRVRNNFQSLLLAADDNQSWVSFLARHLQDFLCTDNGAFVEVVRATSAAGSRILGLMHLDSQRVTRTGDPEIPYLYRDMMGITHEVREWQCIAFSDMPSSAETYWGVGLCAASRAWGAIRIMEATERYIYEKVTGDRALALDLLGGVLQKDIETAVQTAKEDNEARGNSTYLGSVMMAIPSDVPLSHTRINFAELPDGFDRQKEFDIAVLKIANAIGLDVQDLQPLTGRPLGTAMQSEVLEAKSKGKGLAAWRQQFTHQVNEWILPNSVVFAFSETDIRDQQQKANLLNTYAQAAGTLVEKGILSGDQAKQIMADESVIPKEFVPEDTTPRETISDTEKPEVEQESAEETPEPIVEEKGARLSESAFPFEEKSIAKVTRKFHADLRNLAVLGFFSSGSILADVRRVVKDAVEDAYTEGLAEGGVEAEDIEDEDRQAIAELQAEQAAYVTDFVAAIREARDDKAAQREILDSRIDMWTRSIEAAGARGLASAKANSVGVWRMGKTEEHCSTCQGLHQKRHRLKWFTDRGYIPREPGSTVLQCRGFRCECGIYSDTGQRLM